jgi:histidine triad (HIT) family protein
MNDTNCIFCKILAGQIPCACVYSDAHALAFLDIAPFEQGHALVIPRVHAARLVDLTEPQLMALAVAVQRVAGQLLSRLPCDGFNVLQSNGACATQVVPHVHFHVIPRWNGRAINWIPGAYERPSIMTELAARLRG